jgi:hypothetical protein
MPRFWTAGLFCLLFGAAAPALADGKAFDELKSKVLEAKQQLLRARAEKRALQAEKEIPLHPPDAGHSLVPAEIGVGVPETLRNILLTSPSLKGSHTNRQKALEPLKEDTRKSAAEAEQLCRKAMDFRLELLENLAAEENRLGLPVASVGLAKDDFEINWVPSHGWLGWDGSAARAVFWLWLLATLSLWLCAYLGRRERRRWWRKRSRFVRLLFGPLLVLACVAWVGLLGAAIYTLVAWRMLPIGVAEAPRLALEETLRSARDQWDAERQALESNNASLRDEVKKSRGEALERWGESLGLRKSGVERDPERSENEAARALHEILVEAHVAQLSTENAEAVIQQTTKDREELPRHVAERAASAVPWAWVRLILSGALVVLTLVPPLFLLVRRRRRLRRESEQCPGCLEIGKLEIVNAPLRDHRYPEPKYVHCGVCGYEFRLGQLRLPRLCFPTVGLPHSGKTHWLVETYAQINEQLLPTRARVSKSLSLGDQVLDDLLRELRQHYRGPRGTQATEGRFPHPITLHVQDRDASPSEVMVNLFDFGGEMTTRQLQVSVLRRRALMMDGFIFFLDATRPPEEHANQQAELLRFAQDMRHMCDIPESVPIEQPVAVCLPKLDLLPTRTEFSGRAKAWLRRLRQTQRHIVTPALLRQRSRLVREALVNLFPRWPVEEDLRHNFGPNFLFFPLTPVGLEERELEGADLSDLRRRTFAPFGLGEPVLWLLHMHGYRVLG